MLNFEKDSVQFIKTILYVGDMNIYRYYFACPLYDAKCVDIERSDIVDWIVPGKKIMDARHLVLQDNCLEGRHFARDSYTSYVLVSQELKEALESTRDSGVYCARAEDIWSLYKSR